MGKRSKSAESAESAEPLFRSPITKLAATPAGAPVIADESQLTKVSVRAQVAASLFGVDFARAVRRDDVLIAGIRCDEWLLLGSVNDVAKIVAEVPPDPSVNCIGITHSRLCLRLSGERSASVLEKVCSLDFHDLMFPNGAVGSASVARVSADLIRDDIAAEPSYLLLADRSFGQYFYDALVDACQEFADS
ncbi:MAG: hypothetical protein OXB90_11465 [Acidimicrobiaceae bacterium]|nr:hypothetical protein [Acidimicrobiaceae bacterium]